MKYTVIWLPDAEQELARIWLATSNRAAVSQAAKRIDQLLGDDPENAGESRSEGRRILIESPLVVKFRVLSDDRLVLIGNVREFRPRTI